MNFSWIATARGAQLILTLTALCLAGNHVIGRSVHGEIPPLGLTFWRWLIGAIVLAPFALPKFFEQRKIYRKHFKVLALLGFLIVGSTSLLMVALNFTSAINVALINAVQPVLTVLLAAAFFREHLSKAGVVGIFLALFGVVAMLSEANWTNLLNLKSNKGDLIALGAIFGLAVYPLHLTRLPRELSVAEALFAICLSGSLMLLPFYALESVLYATVPLRSSTVIVVLELALVGTVLGNLMWNLGNQIIGPSRAAIFINLIPVFGAILAIGFLGEKLFHYHLIGAAMICLGIWLVVGRRSLRGA